MNAVLLAVAEYLAHIWHTSVYVDEFGGHWVQAKGVVFGYSRVHGYWHWTIWQQIKGLRVESLRYIRR